MKFLSFGLGFYVTNKLLDYIFHKKSKGEVFREKIPRSQRKAMYRVLNIALMWVNTITDKILIKFFGLEEDDG